MTVSYAKALNFFLSRYSVVPNDDTEGDRLEEDESDEEGLNDVDVPETQQPLWVLPFYSLLPASKQARVRKYKFLVREMMESTPGSLLPGYIKFDQVRLLFETETKKPSTSIMYTLKCIMGRVFFFQYSLTPIFHINSSGGWQQTRSLFRSYTFA